MDNVSGSSLFSISLSRRLNPFKRMKEVEHDCIALLVGLQSAFHGEFPSFLTRIQFGIA
jgi:hypothetical protein